MSIQWKSILEETPPTGIEFIAYNPNRGTRKLSAIFKFSTSFSEEKVLSELTSSNYTLWCIVS